jgi:hypothetical protein
MTTISSNLWSTLQGLWHISLEIHTVVTHLMERTREAQLRICVWNVMLLGIKHYGTFCFEVSAAEGPAVMAGYKFVDVILVDMMGDEPSFVQCEGILWTMWKVSGHCCALKL